MLKRAGCESRMQCRESDNALFRHMEANLHNLYPVWSTLATQIDGMEFGEVEGEEWRFKDYDIEACPTPANCRLAVASGGF